MDGNLKECIDLMKNNKIHRVIVEDSKAATFTGFITYETIFEYFISNHYSDMFSFHVKLNCLNISTNNMISATKDDTIYNCLIKFSIHKISVLPILDGDEYFGFFYLKDIIYFFANGEKFSVYHFIKLFLFLFILTCYSSMTPFRNFFMISMKILIQNCHLEKIG